MSTMTTIHAKLSNASLRSESVRPFFGVKYAVAYQGPCAGQGLRADRFADVTATGRDDSNDILNTPPAI